MTVDKMNNSVHFYVRCLLYIRALVGGVTMTSRGSENSHHRTRTNKYILLLIIFLLAGTALVFSECLQRDMRTG